MDFKSMLMSMNFVTFLIALAFMIMSAIIRGSATTATKACKDNKPKDAETPLKNISNTSNIFLVLSLVALGITGFNLYKEYGAQKASVAFYF